MHVCKMAPDNQNGAGEWRREVAVCDSLCDSVGFVV